VVNHRHVYRDVPHLGGPYGCSSSGTSGEEGGGGGDAGADAGLEVAPHAGLDRRRTAIGLEALEVETPALDPLPEVGVVDSTAVGVEGIDHLEEESLAACRLCGRMQSGRARVLARDREVTEDDRRRAARDLVPSGGAVRAAEVGVDDQLRAIPPLVVFRPDRRDLGAGQLSGQGRESRTRMSARPRRSMTKRDGHDTTPA
jgi:hypothetical protein